MDNTTAPAIQTNLLNGWGTARYDVQSTTIRYVTTGGAIATAEFMANVDHDADDAYAAPVAEYTHLRTTWAGMEDAPFPGNSTRYTLGEMVAKAEAGEHF